MHVHGFVRVERPLRLEIILAKVYVPIGTGERKVFCLDAWIFHRLKMHDNTRYVVSRSIALHCCNAAIQRGGFLLATTIGCYTGAFNWQRALCRFLSSRWGKKIPCLSPSLSLCRAVKEHRAPFYLYSLKLLLARRHDRQSR